VHSTKFIIWYILGAKIQFYRLLGVAYRLLGVAYRLLGVVTFFRMQAWTSFSGFWKSE